MRALFSCIVYLLLSCNPNKTIIKIKGSDTEVNLAVQFAESFHQLNGAIIVSVSGGGSGLGVAALLNGNADIANSSRRITRNELLLFQKKNIAIDSFIFAQDAIAFVVASDLQLDTITTTDLAKVLSGQFRNWEPLTQRKLRINIYGRQNNSGTYAFVKEKLGIEFTLYARQMNGNAQVLEAIKADHSGIGYVGAGYVMNERNTGIKVLYISDSARKTVSFPLDSLSIASGRYFFQRPLFQYYRKTSYPKIKTFLDFEKSPAGQAIIRSAGYYTIKQRS